MKKIYLDYAAATPLDPDVLKAMQPFFSEKFYNPSAGYLSARSVRQDVSQARSSIAAVLGARPAEIIFTAGATEANNLAIQGIMRRFPDGEILISSIEHESVLEPAKLFAHKEIPVDEGGTILLNKLSNLINHNTVMLSVMLVNNELGTIQPLGELSKIIQDVLKKRSAAGSRLPLYLHSDAAQAGNYLDLHTSRLGVDLMSINGGKIYGPKQSGALYIKAGVQLQPLIVGGGQEFGLRSGTENIASAVGLARALELAQSRRGGEQKRINELRSYFEEQLIGKLSGTGVNGSLAHRAPHILNLSFDGADNERLMMELDEQGIECALGSACSASSGEPSHTLMAIGLDDAKARSSLRMSLGKYTTKNDIDRTVRVLAELRAVNR